jgi:prolyl-tRNA editing enzyme YbaK/EbsC (Cys-tRNA(Pro) deacylase)
VVSARWQVAGGLEAYPALQRPALLAAPVLAALQRLPETDAARCAVAPIDPDLAETAALCDHYGVPLHASANCVVVTGRRAGEQRWAACVVLATTRADVNGVVRRRLDVRKASFASQHDAVAATGMEYGGITPLGLPAQWPLLLDPAVTSAGELVIGSGIRGSKLLVPGDVLARLPGAEMLDGLGLPVS